MQDLTPLIQAIEANTKQITELTAKVNGIYEALLKSEHGYEVEAGYQEWLKIIKQLTNQAEGDLIIQDALNPNNALAEKLRQQIAEYRKRHPDGGGL